MLNKNFKISSIVAITILLASCATSKHKQDIITNQANGINSTKNEIIKPIVFDDMFQGENISDMINNTQNLTTKEKAELLSQISNVVYKSDNKLYFSFDSYKLSSDNQEKLNIISNVLLEFPNEAIQIQGYSDPIGDTNFNFSLAQNRSVAIYQYLESQGVSRNQMCTLSYGDTKTVVDESITKKYNCKFLAGKPTKTKGCIKAYGLDRRAILSFGKTCDGES